MTMRRRRPKFEVQLDISDPSFMPTPRPVQRVWFLRRALDEMVEELDHLDHLSTTLVPGGPRPTIEHAWHTSSAQLDSSQLTIEGQHVMQAWERPLMARLAHHVAESGGDVLEIGFGMGISATYVQERQVRSHTVVEANEGVRGAFDTWRAQYPDRRISLVSGRWQDVVEDLGEFDGVLFDAYPTTEKEMQQVSRDGALAVDFFAAAASRLRPGGVFSYYTNEVDSVGRSHQRLLLEHFSSFTVEVLRGLRPPADCQYWFADSMAVVRAVR